MSSTADEYEPGSFTLPDEERKINTVNSVYYAIVFVVLGLPIWFVTTSSYRASLPSIAPETHLQYDFETTIFFCNPHIDHGVGNKVEFLLQKYLNDTYSASAVCTDAVSVCMPINLIITSKTCTSSEYSSFVASRKLSKFSAELEANYGKMRTGSFRVSVVPYDAFDDAPTGAQASLQNNGELYIFDRDNAHYTIASLIWKAMQTHILPPANNLRRAFVPIVELPGAHRSAIAIRDPGARKKLFESAVKSGARFRLEFTLVSLRESEFRVGWSRFTRYARAYFEPFRNELTRAGVDIKVRSSVLHEASVTLGAEERRLAANSTAKLTRFNVLRTGAHVSALVNSLERYLTQFEADTTWSGERRAARSLHFVVIVPPRRVSPLYFELPTGNQLMFEAEENVPEGCTASVRIAKWGAVMMLNDADLANTTLETTASTGSHVAAHPFLELGNTELRRVFESTLTHLRVLLGIQPSNEMDSETSSRSDDNAVHVQTLDETTALRKSELGRWLAERTVHSYADAVNTLVALETLLTRIQNMVIRDAIADRVNAAVQQLDAAAAALRRLYKIDENEDGSETAFSASRVDAAFRSAQAALDYAEAAFFDETLLELLYFPEDQKFAIYVPLFLPVGFPVFLAILDVLKYMKRRKTAA